MSEIEKLYENAGIKKAPEFTAEKQLSLIKWLVQKKRREITISFEFLGNNFHFTTDILASSFEKTFEEALARLVNNLWQDLTDTEKAEIKRILE